MTVEAGEQSRHAPNDNMGGHTVRLHIGKDLAGLQKRLRCKRAAQTMSTFRTIEMAEWAVRQVLEANRLKIQIYSKATLLQHKPRIVLTMELNRSVGWGIKRATPDMPVEMSKVVVILECREFNTMPMYILTAYPIA